MTQSEGREQRLKLYTIEYPVRGVNIVQVTATSRTEALRKYANGEDTEAVDHCPRWAGAPRIVGKAIRLDEMEKT